MRTIAYDAGSSAYVIAGVTGSPWLEARWAWVAQFGEPSLFERMMLRKNFCLDMMLRKNFMMLRKNFLLGYDAP